MTGLHLGGQYHAESSNLRIDRIGGSYYLRDLRYLYLYIFII